MTYRITFENATAGSSYPHGIDVKVVVEKASSVIAPGVKWSTDVSSPGRTTVNAHSDSVVGVASASADANLGSPFKSFRAKVTLKGTKLQISLTNDA